MTTRKPRARAPQRRQCFKGWSELAIIALLGLGAYGGIALARAGGCVIERRSVTLCAPEFGAFQRDAGLVAAGFMLLFIQRRGSEPPPLAPLPPRGAGGRFTPKDPPQP